MLANIMWNPKKLISARFVLILLSLTLALVVENAKAVPPAPVAATGQISSYMLGDDGQYQLGVQSTSMRFVDNGDGTISDQLTGLVWLKNTACLGVLDWDNSLTTVSGLSSGLCGLTDRSAAGEWRLPNVLELFSLIHLGSHSPALSSGHPFIGVALQFYWTSTTLDNALGRGRTVDVGYGNIDQSDKALLHYVWPVRNSR